MVSLRTSPVIRLAAEEDEPTGQPGEDQVEQPQRHEERSCRLRGEGVTAGPLRWPSFGTPQVRRPSRRPCGSSRAGHGTLLPPARRKPVGAQAGV
jgi:hypothetical protein